MEQVQARGEPGAAEATSLGPTSEDARRRLLDMVEDGQLQPGQRLGAERDLAVTLGVSRSSLRQALAALERAGVVRRAPGRGGGTFIAPPKVERDLSRIVGVPALLRDQGFAAGSRVVSVGVRVAGAEAARALGIAESDFVVDLVRIRFADESPISLEQAVLPADRVPGLPEKEASILAVQPGHPLLSVTRTTTDASGAIFEFSHDLFRGDRTRMMVRTTGAPAHESARLRGRRLEVV